MIAPPAPPAFDLLQWLDADARAAFGRAARRRTCRAGQTIYDQADAGAEMYRIAAGSVRVSVARSDAREVIFLFFEPGDCFGFSSCIDGGPRPHTAEALTDVVVEVLDLNAFQALRAEHRAFDDALLRVLVAQVRIVSTRYADASLSDLPARVAARIVEAARPLEGAAGGGVQLTLRLPQTELAAMVGASRQSVNRVLQRFQADRLVSIEYGNIVVHDLAALTRLVDRI